MAHSGVRGAMDAVDSDWEKIQIKAFTNWFNDRLRGNLREAPVKVNDITVDLCDGLLMMQMVQGLLRRAGRSGVGMKYNKNPRLKQHKLENLGIILHALKEQKIKLVNIGPEDLMGGSLKLWLGLIWTLIDEFQIKTKKGTSSKKAMLEWLNAVLPMRTTNFTSDWNDGTRLCALIDTLRPGLCPNHASLNPGAGLQNCELGMELAEQHLNVPMLLDPADLNNPIVDELSVMTYLSYFTQSQGEHLLNWLRARLPDHDIMNLTTDWNNGILLSALVDSFSPGLIPNHTKLNPTNALENVTKAMELATRRLGVSTTGIKPSEVTNPKLDELMMATYLTEFKSCQLKAEPGQCLADGAGLVAAQVSSTAEFYVDCSQGGSGQLEVVITGPTLKVTPETHKRSDKPGLYNVSYSPQELGNLSISILYEKQAIPNSPFKVAVVDPASCFVSGDALGGQGSVVGKPVNITVDAKAAGPGVVEPTLFGPSGIQPLKVDSKPGGMKDISSVPTIPGNYSLDLKLSGIPIPGSPFSIAVSDPSKCRLLTSFKDGNLGKVGTPVEVAVDTSKAGPGILTAIATGPSRTVRLQAQGDGGNISTISFVPGEAGEHSVDVLWDGHSIPNCPFTVPAIDVSLCCFEILPSYAQVAKPLIMRLLTQQKISAPVKVQAQTEAGSLVPAKVKQAEEGVYEIQLSPAQIGTLEVDTTWAGSQVSQCPFDIHVCDAKRCSAYGPGLSDIAKIGEPIQFTVQAKDGGQGAVSVTPKGPKTTYSATVQDNGDGTHDVSFTPWEKGTHNIEVDWGTEPISNSPFKVNVTGRILASQLTSSGPGLKEAVALSPAEFQVSSSTPVDISEGNALVVTVQCGKNTAAVDLSDLGDGRCAVTYVAPAPGTYTIKVKYAGEHTTGSPFKAVVSSAPDASRCVVDGSCLNPDSRPLAGDPLDFTVATGDAGYGQLKVAASDPNGGACRVFMANDTPDVYSVRVDTRDPGTYKIGVKWSDHDVPGSPFKVSTSSRITSQGMQAHGPGLKSGKTGEEASFTIHAPMPGLIKKGELTVVISNSKGELTDLKIIDSEDGLYNVTYKPMIAEDHKIALCYNGQNVPGSPFHALITARPMASECVVNGSCVAKNAVSVVGEPMEFEVDTTAAGNGRLVVKAEGPKGEVLRAFQSEEEAGVFSIRLDTSAGTGTYVVNCLWSGDRIPGSPFHLQVDDKLSAQTVVAKGDGLKEVYAMREATFDLNTKKPGLFDNGALKITVVGDSGHIGLAVADNHDGTYTVTYMAPTDGEYVVSIFLNGEDIPGSPFNVTAYLPPKADRCLARGHCLEPDGEMLVGKSAEFTVNTSDAGHGKLTIKANDPSGGHMRTFSSDDGEGVYTIRLDPKETGNYDVVVKWAGDHIPGSPFKLTASAGLSTGTITASGSGLSRAFSQMPTAFQLITPEAGLLEKNDLTVTIDGALRGKAAEVEVQDEGDGSYTVSYMAPSNGAYLASVKYRGKHIPNSPFKITVFPRPSPDKCRVSGKCLEPKSNVICGKPIEFRVATKDAGYGRLVVKAVDPQGATIRAFVAEEGKNVYTVRVDTKRPGKHLINVRWGQTAISGSPFKVRVVQASDASKVRADGPGLRSGGIALGRETAFSIRTHDAGMGAIVVRLHGVKDSFQIKLDRDPKDPRVLHAKYTPKEAGNYEVTILWDGIHIPGSPFLVPILDQHGRQPARQQRKSEAPPERKKIVKVTKTQGVMYQDESGNMVQTEDPAVIARLQAQQVQSRQGALSAGTKTIVEEKRVRRVSKNMDEQGEEAEVVVASGLPPPRRRSADQGIPASQPARAIAGPARAVSPRRQAAGGASDGARALSPQRAAGKPSSGAKARVASPVTQPEYNRSQLARSPSKASYTDDDISPEYDRVFASSTVTQPHRVFKKSASTSNVEPSPTKASKPAKGAKKKFGRKQSEPSVSRNESISAVPRGAGFMADPSGQSRRMFTGELRGARPYRLDYT